MKTILAVALLCAVPALADVYHEPSCPSVDPTRMMEMPRTSAEALGSVPALDCHPIERMRHLGASWSAPMLPAVREEREYVSGYTRADGTYVSGYYRRRPRR